MVYTNKVTGTCYFITIRGELFPVGKRKGTIMTKYEILMLTIPGITEDEMTSFEKHYEKLVKEGKGTVISFEKWGKCRLAYPIKNNEYGVYYLTRFEMDNPQTFFKEIKLLMDVKYHDLIMRSVTVKLAPKQSLEYHRPDTVESIQTRNVDDFLRENKMEGLLPRQEKRREDDTYEDAHDEGIEA